MQRKYWLNLLQTYRVVAVIRSPDVATGMAMAQAAERGGIRLIEVTWSSAQPAPLVTRLRETLPHCWIGAGTLLSAAALKDAIASGAQFGFSPHTSPGMIRQACQLELPLVAGALTPTEIVTAWEAGAAGVKVFPIASVGGAAYVRAVQGPLGHIPLVPTGGVTLENAPQLLAAGAWAVGLSTGLFPTAAIAAQDWSAVTQAAQHLLASCLA